MPPKPPLLNTHNHVAALRAFSRRARRWRPRPADRRRPCPAAFKSCISFSGSSRSSGASSSSRATCGNHHGIGVGKRRRPVRFEKHCGASCCVRGSKMAQIFSRGYLMRNARKRLADGRRMMAEIVHHRHAAGDAAHFHAALDALERVERGLDLLVLQPAMLGAGDDRQRVAHVQFADQVQVKLEAGNFKLRRRRAVADVERVDRIVFAEAEAFHRAMRHVQQRREIRVVAVGEQQAVARNQPDEMLERRFGSRRGFQKCPRGRIPGC